MAMNMIIIIILLSMALIAGGLLFINGKIDKYILLNRGLPVEPEERIRRYYDRGLLLDEPVYRSNIGVPIPAGALKETNDKYYKWRASSGTFPSLSQPLKSDDYFRPYSSTGTELYPKLEFGGPLYTSAMDKYRYAPKLSSVNAFAPFAEISSDWEKIGLLQTEDSSDNTVLNIYRRPIAPLQDLFEYRVQDKDGFIIPLKTNGYLEDGDIIPSITGKESLGSWKVNIFVNNKWVYA